MVALPSSVRSQAPQGTYDPIQAVERARDATRDAFKNGIDLSASEVRKQFLYDPVLSKVSESLRTATEGVLDQSEKNLSEVAHESNYDIGDRYFNGLADSMRSSKAVGAFPANDLATQSAIVARNICAIYPISCDKPPEPKESPLLSAVKKLRGANCSQGAPLICNPRDNGWEVIARNPYQTYINECTVGATLIPPDNVGDITTAFVAQCRPADKGMEIVSLTQIPIGQLQQKYVEKDKRTGRATYGGSGYATMCMPCTSQPRPLIEFDGSGFRFNPRP